MHPTLMRAFATERSAALRATAASHRRGRLTSLRRPHAVRRPRRLRVAHA